MRKPILAAAAAISMLSVSSGAVAQSAAPLSIADFHRAGADLAEPNDYRGGIIIPTLVILALVAAIYLATKGGDPASP